jgi:hypothetical protein
MRLVADAIRENPEAARELEWGAKSRAHADGAELMVRAKL